MRISYSITLLGIGLILAFAFTGARSLTADPDKVLTKSLNEDIFLSVDQVARAIADNDSTIRLIDLRNREEFRSSGLPGAVNIPYEEFLRSGMTYLEAGTTRNILYSNDDLTACLAFVYATGMDIESARVMKGGINEWIKTIMNTRFTGGRITARENSIFEARTRAGRMFTEFNSMPDSLRDKLMTSRRLEARKLDGGCE